MSKSLNTLQCCYAALLSTCAEYLGLNTCEFWTNTKGEGHKHLTSVRDESACMPTINRPFFCLSAVYLSL